MGITVAFAQMMGTSIDCRISEYLRTIVYRVPGFLVKEGFNSSVVVQSTPDLRAAIVTDPLKYLGEEDFSDQYHLDVSFPETLQNKCSPYMREAGSEIFIVIQLKENMRSFLAIDGQCIRAEHDGVERLFVVDCDDAAMPSPDEREDSISEVLAAVREGLGVTGEFEDIFAARCYRTDDDECLYPLSVEFRVGKVEVFTPLTPEELTAKSEAVRVLAAKVEKGVDEGDVSGGQGSILVPKVFLSYSWDSEDHKHWVKEFATRLRADGIDVTLDQWETVHGDQLATFMESAIRESQFVLIVCTPSYKVRSEQREGGVGYEGDVLTAEMMTDRNNRKFIPVLRSNTWKNAAPSWLSGKIYSDLSADPYSEQNYQDLVRTLLGMRELPPPIGKPMSTFDLD